MSRLGRRLLLAALLLSALAGLQIFLTDTDLWEAAPSHAYGLLVFIILDLVATALSVALPKLGLPAAMTWGTVKFFLLLGDILTAKNVGFHSYSQFMEYLFSLWNFDTLLVLQLIIAILAYKAYRAQRLA